MATVKQICEFINGRFPFETQEDFDNSGHLLGNPEQSVSRALVALDVTNEVVGEAVNDEIDLIITHHPVIFHPLKKVMSSDLVYTLIQQGVNIISAHTNLDKGQGGVNDVLAGRLGLSDIEGFEGSDDMGRIGNLPEPIEPNEFAAYVKRRLGANGVRYVSGNHPVQMVAVIGGGGDFAMEAAIAAGSDALVTGEARHHTFMQAKNLGFTYVDAGHFATENVICPVLCELLDKGFPEVDFHVSGLESPVIYLGK